MAWIIGEHTRRSASKRDDNTVLERLWIARQVDGSGAIIQSNAEDVFSAMTATVKLGDAYPGLPGVKCVEISPVCRDDSEIWDVAARYEIPSVEEETPDDFSEFLFQSQNNSATNMIGPEFSGGGVIVEEYLWQDLDGQPFVNLAFQPLNPVPSIPITIQVDRVTINERNKPNTASVGVAEGRRLLADISYSSAIHTNSTTGVRTKYFKNTYEVWTHPYRNWSELHVLNAGFMQRAQDENGLEKEPENIIDPKTGEPVTEQVPLGLDGKRLPPGDKEIFVVFRIRRSGQINVPFLTVSGGVT